MGRKRNQGKARKAAKAKAEEAAEESNNQTTNGRQQSLATQTQQLQVGNASPHDTNTATSGSGTTIKCLHGFEQTDTLTKNCFQFVHAFSDAYDRETAKDGDANLEACLMAAKNATQDRFAEVWNDSANMEIVISLYLSEGAQYILEGNYGHAGDCAVFARWFEQCTAVELYRTQALENWPKIQEMFDADIHTLVKFCRKRIPCSCLDEKYEQVKGFNKLGNCYNPDCPISFGQVERGKTFYCSRCRCITYCSRECQKADWTAHKQECDECVARIAKFEAKKQS